MHVGNTLSIADIPTKVDPEVNGFEVFRIELPSDYFMLNPTLLGTTEEHLQEATLKGEHLALLYDRSDEVGPKRAINRRSP